MYKVSTGLIDRLEKDDKPELRALAAALKVIDVEQNLDLADYDHYAKLIVEYRECDFNAVLDQLRVIKVRIDTRMLLIRAIEAQIRAIPDAHLAGAKIKFSEGDRFEIVGVDDPEVIWSAYYGDPDLVNKMMAISNAKNPPGIWWYPGWQSNSKHRIDWFGDHFEIVESLSLDLKPVKVANPLAGNKLEYNVGDEWVIKPDDYATKVVESEELIDYTGKELKRRVYSFRSDGYSFAINRDGDPDGVYEVDCENGHLIVVALP